MLKPVNLKRITLRVIAVLHIFISFFTFQLYASVDSKSKIAEEYRSEGYELQQKGKFTEALTFYSKALSLGLNSPVIYNDMGILHEQLGLSSRAEQYYLQALKQDRGYLPAYSNLAYLYLQEGNKSKAKDYFQLRYELAPEGDPWRYKIEDELVKLSPHYKDIILKRQADRLLEEMEEKRRQILAEQVRLSNEHIKRAESYLSSGNYRLAIQEYDKALAITPNNPQIIKAKKDTILKVSKESVKERSEEVLRMLEAGNTTSAKIEIQKMLTSIPSEQVLNSK